VAAHLGQPRDTRLYPQSLRKAWYLAAELFNQEWTLRPWPDQAHFAHQNVDNLRHFIKPELSEQSTNICHALIVIGCPYRSGPGFGVLNHRTEFHDLKPLAKPPDTLLGIKDWATITKPYGEWNHYPQKNPQRE